MYYNSYVITPDVPCDLSSRSKLVSARDLDRQKRLHDLLTLEDSSDDELCETPLSFIPGAETSIVAPGIECLATGAELSRIPGSIEISSYSAISHVPVHTLNAFFVASMFSSSLSSPRLYNALMRIPSRIDGVILGFKHSDGQLKIATDFLIGVDNMIHRALEKKKFSILVIGSSSVGESNGFSYSILETIVGYEFYIDLYDIYEFPRTIVTGNVTYVYHRDVYVYDSVDIVRYDIVFDDAYNPLVQHGHTGVDPSFVIEKARDYSCKSMPGDSFVSSYDYNQSCATASGELRATKFPRLIKEFTRRFPGNCASCVHLNYYLYQDYGQSTLDYFLRCHKQSCVGSVQSFLATNRSVDRCCRPSNLSVGRSELKICDKHETKWNLALVKNLSVNRDIKAYSSDNEWGPDILINGDYGLDRRSIVIYDVDIDVIRLSKSIIIQVDQDYYVSNIMIDEVELKSDRQIQFDYQPPISLPFQTRSKVKLRKRMNKREDKKKSKVSGISVVPNGAFAKKKV